MKSRYNTPLMKEASQIFLGVHTEQGPKKISLAKAAEIIPSLGLPEVLTLWHCVQQIMDTHGIADDEPVFIAIKRRVSALGVDQLVQTDKEGMITQWYQIE